MRMLDADVVPLDFTSAAKTFSKYVDEVVQLADKTRTDTEEFNQYLTEGRFAQIIDPTDPVVAPKAKDVVPYLNFAPLLNAREQLDAAAAGYAAAVKPVLAGERSLTAEQNAELGAILLAAERELLAQKDGLPRRPWYKHMVYAPGYYTGYGVKTLPGVREGIEERQWDEAQTQIELTAAALNRFTAAITEATAAMQ